MRIDVPAKPLAARPPGTRHPLITLGAVFALVLCGMALPLFGADSLDNVMKARGWRQGQPRVPARQVRVAARRRLCRPQAVPGPQTAHACAQPL